MTVVVWDGETLATDRQASDGSLKWETDKAWYVGRGDSIYIVSGVGLLKNIIELREWFKRGENLNTTSQYNKTMRNIVKKNNNILPEYAP